MSAVDEILSNVPLDQIAERLGESPEAVHDAAYAVVPALLGGLQANAADPAGEKSLLGALDQHTGDVEVDKVDVADGEKAAAHIFGASQDDVIKQLGGTGVNNDLVKKLLPILIPIVLAWLSKKVSGTSGATPSQAGGGVLGSILSQVIAGAAGSQRGSMPSVGSIIGDVLGGLLGGGRR